MHTDLKAVQQNGEVLQNVMSTCWVIVLTEKEKQNDQRQKKKKKKKKNEKAIW